VLKYLPKSKYSSALILKKVLDSDTGYISECQKELINKTGEARTILRPAGKVMIENKLIDVVTQGEFIEAGTMVKVIATDNNRIIVKQIKA